MRLVLPYAIEDVDRKKPFTGEMEVAAIQCLAEAERKRGALIAQPETISFISKLYYPLWAIPWEGESLIVDGLAVCSYKIPLYRPPDVEPFVEDIRKNSKSYKHFYSALKRHSKTFKTLTPAQPISVEAILDQEALLAISNCFQRASVLEEGGLGPSFLSPSVNVETAIEKASAVTYHWRLAQSGIKALRYALEVLDEGTKFHQQKILNEIELLKKKFEDEILAIKPISDKKVKQAAKERDSKIENVIREAERRTEALLRRKEKAEDKLGRLEEKKDLYKMRKEASKRRKDKLGEKLWKKRMERCNAEIERVKGEIHEISKIMKLVIEKRNTAVKKFNEDFLEIVSQEEKKIASINSYRDYKIAAKQNEIKSLQKQSSVIADQIKDLMEQMAQQASKLKVTVRLGGEISLVYVPFYIIKYKAERKSRYQVHAPVTAMGYGGIVKNIQKAILSFSLDSRIRLLLRPMSKVLKDMFSSLEKRMHEEEALEKKIVEAAISSNLLLAPGFRDGLDRGLEELKSEGWIKQEEKDSILSTYDVELSLPRVGEIY